MFKLDKELIKNILQKDKEAFDRFYLHTIDKFFRYVKSNYFISDADVHDLLSNFYYKVWMSLGSYKVENNFEAWIWTIFKNLLKDYFKKSKDIHFSQIDTFENSSFGDNLASDEDIMGFMETDFEYNKIIQAIDRLDENSKEIVTLRFIEEKNSDEISELLGISNDNVRQRLSRAVKKLKSFLD